LDWMTLDEMEWNGINQMEWNNLNEYESTRNTERQRVSENGTRNVEDTKYTLNNRVCNLKMATSFRANQYHIHPDSHQHTE